MKGIFSRNFSDPPRYSLRFSDLRQEIGGETSKRYSEDITNKLYRLRGGVTRATFPLLRALDAGFRPKILERNNHGS